MLPGLARVMKAKQGDRLGEADLNRRRQHEKASRSGGCRRNEGLSRAAVELGGDRVKRGLVEPTQVGALRQVLVFR